MALYAISDLHLALSTDKPMDIFGAHWTNHDEKIKNNWIEKITEDVLSKTTQSIYENNRQFKYEISATILLFNQTLIVSLISLIISIIFNIIEKQRKIC